MPTPPAGAPDSRYTSDRQYGLIGCAERTVGGTPWFACVLAAGPLPAPPVLVLPDMAMP